MSDINTANPVSIRDAFLLGGGESCLPGINFLRVENIREYFDKDSPYADLISFERDIAQLSELVILIPESPGSFAELGSFVMEQGISENLLVVIQSRYLSMKSFIANGPIAAIKKQSGNSVFAIVDAMIGIVGENVSGINCQALVSVLVNPMSVRMKESEQKTTFNAAKFSHMAKLYVGLLREFYALNDVEIMLLLENFGSRVDSEVLNRVAFCCSAIGWSGTVSAGFDRIHFARPGNEAAKFEFSKEFSDKLRRRTEIRAFWLQDDPTRVAVVDEVLKP